MTENTIQCPKCGTVISITDALSADIKEQYKKEFQQIISKRETELVQLQSNLAKEKEQLAQKQIEIDKTVQDKLKIEREALEKKLRNDVYSQAQLEMEDLKIQLTENKKRAEEAQKNELEFRKRTRDLEEKERSVELELQRRLDVEKTKIQEETAHKITEDLRLKSAEKDKQLEDMRKQIEDLKRKAEQGSQQTQGEVLELEIESTLKMLFPIDGIEPVPKGVRGGDIIQKVTTNSGQHAGTIIWETKRTKSWSDGWVTKLKDDQRAIAAECAVLITQALPKEVTNFELIDGIWVVDFTTFRALASALRINIIQVYQAKAMAVGKGEKLDFLYNYLIGTQFKQRVEIIVESFKTMKEDLEKEKRAIQKTWASREQQINRVLESTIGMHGDIQGIVGTNLPKIESLEFEESEVHKEIKN